MTTNDKAPCDTCKRQTCPDRCYPLQDWLRHHRQQRPLCPAGIPAGRPPHPRQTGDSDGHQ